MDQGETIEGILSQLIPDPEQRQQVWDQAEEVDIRLPDFEDLVSVPTDQIRPTLITAKSVIIQQALPQLWTVHILPLIDQGAKQAGVIQLLQQLGASVDPDSEPPQLSGELTFELPDFNQPVSVPAEQSSVMVQAEERLDLFAQQIESGIRCDRCHADDYQDSEAEIVAQSYQFQLEDGQPDRSRSNQDNPYITQLQVQRSCNRCQLEWSIDSTREEILDYPEVEEVESQESASRGRQLEISGQMKIRTLKANFHQLFGSHLRLYDGNRLADEDATVASIAKTRISVGTSISAHGRTKVGNFEDNMMEAFGIRIQVANTDDNRLVNNDLSLAQSGRSDSEQRVIKLEGYQASSLEIEAEGFNLYQAEAEVIAEWVAEVVRVEAPVHKDIVCRRICQPLGIERIGNNIVAAIDRGIAHLLERQEIRQIEELRQMEDEEGNSSQRHYYFLYQASEEETGLARDWSEAEQRSPLLIADEEIRSAAYELFGNPVEWGDQSDSIRQIWSVLGFGRVSQEMNRQAEIALKTIQRVIKLERYQASSLEIEAEGFNLYQAEAEVIAEWVAEVVRVEAPVHKDIVCRRICQPLGIERIGNNIVAAIDRGIAHLLERQEIRQIEELRQMEDEEGNSSQRHYYFLYQASEEETGLARDWSEAEQRSPLLIADEEIRSAAYELFGNPVEWGDQSDSIRQIWSVLGFGRVSQEMNRQAEIALKTIQRKEEVAAE